jgi:hypothetical protein
MSELDLQCSELVRELEGLGHYGIGYFAGLLVEYRPVLAEELSAAIKLNQDES